MWHRRQIIFTRLLSQPEKSTEWRIERRCFVLLLKKRMERKEKHRLISIVLFKGILWKFLQYSFNIVMVYWFSQQFQRFPDIDLPERMYGDVAFKDLPVCHIRVSKNNTIVSVTDNKGKVVAINSCGKEGYKNCRKGTNIAGQATAITLSKVNWNEHCSMRFKLVT